MPAGVTSFSWHCSASGGASCTASGSGHLTDTLATFPVGGEVIYTIVASLLNSGVTIINTATITPPVGVTNTAPDNSASNISEAGGNIFLPAILRNAGTP